MCDRRCETLARGTRLSTLSRAWQYRALAPGTARQIEMEKGFKEWGGRDRMADNPVSIAGGGFGGLATALTLHQIGVPCVVFEAVGDMRPLGVGINLQPNAVRELNDLG